MSLWAQSKEVWAAWKDPLDLFDDDFPDSHPFTDPIPLDADCLDTAGHGRGRRATAAGLGPQPRRARPSLSGRAGDPPRITRPLADGARAGIMGRDARRR